jgi:hypothetical protein
MTCKKKYTQRLSFATTFKLNNKLKTEIEREKVGEREISKVCELPFVPAPALRLPLCIRLQESKQFNFLQRLIFTIITLLVISH